MGRPKLSLAQRLTKERLAAFWSNANRDGGLDSCWEWRGPLSTGGYGSTNLRGKTERAHRVAYELVYGKIEDGLLVRHACDNRRCINPNHLSLGTHRDNALDRTHRGRAAAGCALRPEESEHWIDVFQEYGIDPKAVWCVEFPEYARAFADGLTKIGARMGQKEFSKLVERQRRRRGAAKSDAMSRDYVRLPDEVSTHDGVATYGADLGNGGRRGYTPGSPD